MYQALYRKYRPKTFDDVFGQDVIIKTLKNSVIQNKISHAYLFTGPRGCGKTSIAKILAKTVNCQHLNGAEVCNECVCCTQSNNQNMDIIEIDAASNNGVDEIREINNKVNLVPSLGKYKIYIIDEVHMLTIGAFNALLKTLEEPPSHVIFILATTDPQKVPVTILSRCQRFDFKKISEKKMYDRLKYIAEQEKIDIEDTALEEIARLGDGSLRDAISILDQVLAYADKKITIEDIHDVNGTISQENLQNLLAKVYKNDIAGVIAEIDEYSNNGKSIVKIAEDIILLLRDMILAKITTGNSPLKQFSSDLTNETILNHINIMNQTLLDMKKFSNPKMLLELGLIKMLDSLGNEKTIVIQENVVEKTTKDKMNDKTVEKEKTKVDETKKEEDVKDSQTFISWEMEKPHKTNINDDNEKAFDQFIKLRINNTLAHFSKKELLDVKTKLRSVDEYLLDENFGSLASTILDGQLKAVSDEYMVFVYPTIHLARSFNEKIPALEEFMKKVLEKPYKVIAVDSDEWDIIKEQFNNKQTTYSYQEEHTNIQDILEKLITKEEDGIASLFGDIVEYK